MPPKHAHPHGGPPGLNKAHHDNGNHHGHHKHGGGHGGGPGLPSLGMCLLCRFKVDACCNGCQAYKPPCDLCTGCFHGILDNICGKLCGCGYLKSRETFRDCCGPCCAIDRWFCWLCDCCCAARGFHAGHPGHPHGGPPGLAGGGPPGQMMK